MIKITDISASIPGLDTNQMMFMVFIVLVLGVIYLIVREFRLMKTVNKRLEMELDKQKLELIAEDIQGRGKGDLGLMLMTLDQLKEIKDVTEDVATLERDCLALETAVETRMRRLDSGMKLKKMGKMMEKITENEGKIFKK